MNGTALVPWRPPDGHYGQRRGTSRSEFRGLSVECHTSSKILVNSIPSDFKILGATDLISLHAVSCGVLLLSSAISTFECETSHLL